MTLQFNQPVADLWTDFQEAMTAIGIVGLRSVQYDVLNAIAKAHDLVVVCPSGHGKTTAALLAAAWTMSKAGGSIASCMVMAVESEREVKRIISSLAVMPSYDPLKVLPLYPTSDARLFKNRTERLRQEPNIIVTTPDRLLVHLRVGNTSASQFGIFIVDDVDVICDKGLFRDLEKIFSLLENHTCRVLFSSTDRPSLKQSIETFVRK
ncbi:MAG TPA: hypothetical protein DCR43_00750 [Bacteroidales bacterium]|nr:MAG: hypothetical protein A2X11_04440 [Bacteroidetes bacterium GWE2_42_24]OFY27661.1 MAG: hypothetical protein A2X09_10680 [Bacteroidetes bacterium GWF2_43_11]HAQ64380.1 hypothetical protein [Bacteroidales bacterium]HBZ66507.1 hypothetical protein [Bacteroidales bacterium]